MLASTVEALQSLANGSGQEIYETRSSAGRWANLINDLQSDLVIRENFQFWSFPRKQGILSPILPGNCGRRSKPPSTSSIHKARIQRCDELSL
jgi:hypothetical protein